MASGHRKRKAAALRIEVLNPAGLTNVSEADRGNTTNQNNLINIATYSRDGVAPTFTAASTTLLSNAVSNADSAWTKAGLTGETTNAGVFVATSMSGAVGITAATKHYYFPVVGGTRTDLSSSNTPSSPVILYSAEGPQASYVPYYLGGTTSTASIVFGTQVTGTGSPTHVVVYVGGELEASDRIRIMKASDGTLYGTASFMTGANTGTGSNSGTTIVSGSELSANLYRKAFFLTTSSINTARGFVVEFSSSAKTSTTPVAGIFVAISSGSY